MSNVKTQSIIKALALTFLVLTLVTFGGAALQTRVKSPKPLEDFRVLSRQLRVDLIWKKTDPLPTYEIQRAENPSGPFVWLHDNDPALTVYSDFIGHAGGNYYYRVRSVSTNEDGKVYSDWSAAIKGSPQPLNDEKLLSEVQEASFRYFYYYAHSVSGLTREKTGWDHDLCAIGDSGMGLYNLVVGIQRGFITRQEGINRALKVLRF